MNADIVKAKELLAKIRRATEKKKKNIYKIQTCGSGLYYALTFGISK